MTKMPPSMLDQISDNDYVPYVRAALMDLFDHPDSAATAARWLKALTEMTSGAKVDTSQFFKTFDIGRYDEMVVVGPISFYSLCEHHLMPFHGDAWVGYLPGKSGRVIGLSKMPRLVLAHAKRFQVQERMTRDIARDLHAGLKAAGVGVRIESLHTCCAARGVERAALMRTQALLGAFKKLEVKQEFNSLCRRSV